MENTKLNQVINQVLADYTIANQHGHNIPVARLSHYLHYYNQDGDPIETASIELNLTQDDTIDDKLLDILQSNPDSIQNKLIEALTQYMAQDSNAEDITTTNIQDCSASPTIITNGNTGHTIIICGSDTGLHITSFKVLN